MAPEKITALIKGHRVGQYAAHGFKLYSRRCDNVVHDAKQKFALHEDLACDQKIRVLSDRACQRIFDRNDCGGSRPTLHPVEYLE
jgi:hypothetical protein